MRAIRCLLAAVLAAGIVTVVAAQQPGDRFGGQQDVDTAVFTNAELKKELKVTAEQETKLKPGAEKIEALAKKRGEMFGKGKGGFDKEKLTELQEEGKKVAEETKKIAEETLTADQKKRVHQIKIRAAGFAALGNPEAKAEKGKGGFGGVSEATKAIQKEVTAALKLTDAQETAVKETVDAYNKEAREIRTEYGLGFGGGFGKDKKEVDKDKQAEGTKKLEEARKKAWAKVEGGLTAEQKTAWKGLVGEEFDLAKLRPAPMPKKD